MNNPGGIIMFQNITNFIYNNPVAFSLVLLGALLLPNPLTLFFAKNEEKKLEKKQSFISKHLEKLGAYLQKKYCCDDPSNQQANNSDTTDTGQDKEQKNPEDKDGKPVQDGKPETDNQQPEGNPEEVADSNTEESTESEEQVASAISFRQKKSDEAIEKIESEAALSMEDFISAAEKVTKQAVAIKKAQLENERKINEQKMAESFTKNLPPELRKLFESQEAKELSEKGKDSKENQEG